MSETNTKGAGMPDSDGEQPGYDFATAFWSAKHALAHASATAFARHGVHEGQQFVLRCLWREDGLSPGEIARRLGLSTPTVTRAATRMEAAGLLRREPHPGDRRLVRLRLTDRGRNLEKVIDAEMYRVTERARMRPGRQLADQPPPLAGGQPGVGCLPDQLVTEQRHLLGPVGPAVLLPTS